jgi:hypothetical protein
MRILLTMALTGSTNLPTDNDYDQVYGPFWTRQAVMFGPLQARQERQAAKVDLAFTMAELLFPLQNSL